MSDVARRETKSQIQLQKCVLMSDIISLDDGPRRKAKVLQAIKSDDQGRSIHNDITRSSCSSTWRAALCCGSHGFSLKLSSLHP